MKRIVLLVMLSLFVLSCSSPTDTKTEKGTQEIIKPDFLSPDHFEGKFKAKAMVLGVFHFSNPGLDSYKPKFPFNILEAKRQKELDELLSKIEAYQPTKILIEWNRIKHDSLTNVRFQAYLKDSLDLSDKTNEVYQIGFKLAKRLNHQHIYCSDASTDWCGAELDWDNFDEETYARSRGQYQKMTRYDFDKVYNYDDSLKTVQTLTEHFIWMNQPENAQKDHQAYLTSILIGAGDNYIGADNIANWYRRNLRIFSNAYDLTDFNQEERILLIYGAGHLWQLRQLFKDSPDFEYIEANDFLN